MRVIVAGSKNYDKYEVFQRAVAASLEEMSDANGDHFYMYGVGPKNINNYGQEFSNITENYLRGKGIKISFIRMPEREAIKRIFDSGIGRVLYFGSSESKSNVVQAAQAADIDVHVYKY